MSISIPDSQLFRDVLEILHRPGIEELTKHHHLDNVPEETTETCDDDPTDKHEPWEPALACSGSSSSSS
jgi:hypothetical protein